jgi:hypothetical protein
MRLLLTILAAVTLVSCSLSGVPPSVVRYNVTQDAASARLSELSRPDNGPSGMERGLASQSLLYVSDYYRDVVDVYTYPGGVRVGKLGGYVFVYPRGLCANAAGNIWVVDTASQKIVEFRHGGARPVRTLEEKRGFPLACSVDPKTGDLAVSNNSNYEGGSVLIFRQAHGTEGFSSFETARRA